MVDVDLKLVDRLAELVDAPPWEMADVLVDEFPEKDYPITTGTRSGLYEALDAYEDALRKERGIILKASTMRNYRATALAWPGALRSAPAPFEAYKRLRGKNGQVLMERYLKRNKGRPLSVKDVARYRSDDKGPSVVLTPEERFEQRLRSTVRSALLGGVKPAGDWWKSPQITTDVREMAVEVLHRLANDLLAGSDG